MSKLIQLLAANRKRAPKAQGIVKNGDETTIYIYDAIVSDDMTAEWWGGVSAQSLVPEIRAIQGGIIHLRLNTPGGDVFAAQAICHAIRETTAKVIAHIDGYAASAGTVIATAADEVEISEGGMYMIHCGWTIAIGNATELQATSDLLGKVDGVIASQYAKKSGKSVDEVMGLMQAETWFTAQEAVDAGLIDRISDAPKAKASWDLSAYANAPQASNDSITAEHRERQQQRMRMLNRISYQ